MPSTERLCNQAEQLDLKATEEIWSSSGNGAWYMFNSELYENVVLNLENLQQHARSMRKVAAAGSEMDNFESGLTKIIGQGTGESRKIP